MTQATIDIRLANMQKMEQHKFNRLLAILQTEVEKAFSESMSDVSVFGLGKNGKNEVVAFLENLFNESSAFDDLNEDYY